MNEICKFVLIRGSFHVVSKLEFAIFITEWDENFTMKMKNGNLHRDLVFHWHTIELSSGSLSFFLWSFFLSFPWKLFRSRKIDSFHAHSLSHTQAKWRKKVFSLFAWRKREFFHFPTHIGWEFGTKRLFRRSTQIPSALFWWRKKRKRREKRQEKCT